MCGAIFSSCFILEEYENMSEEQENAGKPTRQLILQDSVIAYFSRQYTEDNQYLPYTFSSVFANKPQEIVELEQLYEVQASLPGMQDHYGERLDSVIAANNQEIDKKKETIREKKIYTTYDLTHLFCVKNKDEKLEPYKAIEVDVYAYPTNKIKDVRVIFSVPLTEHEFELFEHYIHQDPLIYDQSYDYQAQMNASIYNKMNEAMINEPAESRGDLLMTLLNKVEFYQLNNGFDPELFTNAVLSDWSKDPTLDVKIDKVIKTSELKPIKSPATASTGNIPSEQVVGYKKFMLINGKWGDESFREEKAVYCEFDKNHVLKGVLLVEGDYQNYFE